MGVQTGKATVHGGSKFGISKIQLEPNSAMAERTAAFEERDVALLLRDAAYAERDSAMAERDAAFTALDIALEGNRNFVQKLASVKDSKLSMKKDRTVLGARHPAASSPIRCSAAVHEQTDVSKIGEKAQKRRKTESKIGDAKDSLSGGRKRKRVVKSTPDRKVRAKRSCSSPKEHCVELGERDKRDDLKGPNDDVNVDSVRYPVPYCTCTGARQECYRWGNGGWQSSCCTAMISMYPLPMNPTKRGSRLAGRKISAGAFEKLLEKLGSEGVDVSHPVDLKDHWAKHGTTRYVYLRKMRASSFV
ncbi:unnamed protein product [Calypogeia fissa]